MLNSTVCNLVNAGVQPGNGELVFFTLDQVLLDELDGSIFEEVVVVADPIAGTVALDHTAEIGTEHAYFRPASVIVVLGVAVPEDVAKAGCEQQGLDNFGMPLVERILGNQVGHHGCGQGGGGAGVGGNGIVVYELACHNLGHLLMTVQVQVGHGGDFGLDIAVSVLEVRVYIVVGEHFAIVVLVGGYGNGVVGQGEVVPFGHGCEVDGSVMVDEVVQDGGFFVIGQLVGFVILEDVAEVGIVVDADGKVFVSGAIGKIGVEVHAVGACGVKKVHVGKGRDVHGQSYVVG